MAFNLKKVLKALLFSSSQPLSIKEIQEAFTRFHEPGAAGPAPAAAGLNPATEAGAAALRGGAGAAPAEAAVESPAEAELYARCRRW